MESVGAFEAKTHLSHLLERVACGESIVITKHGIAVAKLVPFKEAPAKNLHKVVEEINQLRASLPSIPSKDIKKLIEEGRKH